MQRRARLALLLSAVLLVALPSSLTAAERFKPFRLKAFDTGQQTALADVLGKSTLVVFFFPNCPYCNAALPHIQRLADRYRSDGLSTVWVNVVQDEESLIPAWRAAHGYSVPILLGGMATQRTYNLRMTPTDYLLDATGAVVSKHAGYSPGDEVRLERDVRAALGLPAQ